MDKIFEIKDTIDSYHNLFLVQHSNRDNKK